MAQCPESYPSSSSGWPSGPLLLSPRPRIPPVRWPAGVGSRRASPVTQHSAGGGLGRARHKAGNQAGLKGMGGMHTLHLVSFSVKLRIPKQSHLELRRHSDTLSSTKQLLFFFLLKLVSHEVALEATSSASHTGAVLRVLTTRIRTGDQPLLPF